MKSFVYVLKSLKDNRQYIGSTINVDKRLAQHNNGSVKSTKHRLPFIIKYVIEYDDIKKAAEMEKKFKRSHDALLKELKQRGIAQR
ncbi:MAG: GIY-YIG nuclease family protein [Patescibacteria group bacterium]